MFIPLPMPAKVPGDPYNITEITNNPASPSNCILLVAPRKRAPGRLVPGPVVNGVPVGIIQADTTEHLLPWTRALATTAARETPATWAALAMNKEFYLGWGHRWFQWMRQAATNRSINTAAWLADTVTRDQVCTHLAQGPSLAVYAGHGRARGWSGYRALRWHHIAAEQQYSPCGTVISLACDTLKRSRGMVPFGCHWVNEGRACAYAGSVECLGIKANDAFAQVLGELFSSGEYNTIGQLLAAVDRYLKNHPEAKDAKKGFVTYRLMGNPLQKLF